MDHTFSFVKDKDVYRVTVEAPAVAGNLYLCGAPPELGWSTSYDDARVFQYGVEAIGYMLKHTKLRRFKHPIINGHVIVDFDANTLIIRQNGAPDMTMDFNLYKSLVALPLHKVSK